MSLQFEHVLVMQKPIKTNVSSLKILTLCKQMFRFEELEGPTYQIWNTTQVVWRWLVFWLHFIFSNLLTGFHTHMDSHGLIWSHVSETSQLSEWNASGIPDELQAPRTCRAFIQILGWPARSLCGRETSRQKSETAVVMFFFQKLWLLQLRDTTGAQLYRQFLKVSSRHAWQKLRDFLNGTKNVHHGWWDQSPSIHLLVSISNPWIKNKQTLLLGSQDMSFPIPDSFKLPPDSPFGAVSWCRFFCVK